MTDPSENSVTNRNNNNNGSTANTVNNSGQTSGSANQSYLIEFAYADTDLYQNEVAELYSYSEEIDFAPNRNAFEELMEDYGYPLKWTHMSDDQKHRATERMAEGIEFSDRSSRIRAIRALLYLCQGNFGDCLVIDEQPKYARKNIFHLYKYGLFFTFIQLIHYEIEQASLIAESATDATSTITNSNHPNVSLRLLINIVYLFVQEMYVECTDSDTENEKKLRQQFKEELMQPICGELLHITLFDMIVKHCNGPKTFPIKKTLLLIWKVILVTLGGHDELSRLKNHYREQAGLKPIPDDTIEVTKRMMPSSPPPTTAEMIDLHRQQRKFNRFKRQTVVKQSSFGDESYTPSSNFNDESNGSDDDILNDDAFESPNGTDNGNGHGNENDNINLDGNDNENKQGELNPPGTPVPPLDTEECAPNKMFSIPYDKLVIVSEYKKLNALRYPNKSLPWQPKVRQKDIELFLSQVRKKFVGYSLPNDCITTAGLPMPIMESIQVLKKHLYESLGEMQIKREEEFARYPLTMKELNKESVDSFAEQLYRAMLPNLQHYLIVLLKLLLAAISNLKTGKNEHTVLNDILPNDPPSNVLQSLKLNIDVNRHHEIIIKAISGIMILLLKHYKINHIYQFEYICQQLMFANCIPLVIKFISQEMTEFIQFKNNIPVLDFPACVIGEQPELTPDTIEMLSETQTFSWRNIYSSINLLRVLNKLTKWKNCRIVMLVVFKSAQPLKRALRVRQAMFQLYVLKLLKIQAKFLGRQWRKSNMKTMSDIYTKVRHRLNDDWAFANDVDSKSVCAQSEEFLLQANINRFHHRRYERPCPNNINSVTAQTFSNNPSGLIGVKISEPLSNSITCLSPSTALGMANSVLNNLNQTDIAGGGGGNNNNNNMNGNNNNNNNNKNNNNRLLQLLNPSLAAIAETDLLKPVDNNLLSLLSKKIKLTKEFKKNYEKWLDREVFHFKINWDELLEQPVDIDEITCKLIENANQVDK